MEEKKGIGVISREKASNESALVASAQRGDKTAFGSLVRLHQRRLLRLALGLVGDLDSAMDIVQDSFVRAWQALERFDEKQPFYPWISRIASNLALNFIKRRGREVSLDAEVLERPSGDPDPLEKMRLDESDRRLMQAVRELPEPYRVVFVLRHMEDLSYEEIAARLGVAAGTVDSRLYRARRLLVEKLGELLD